MEFDDEEWKDNFPMTCRSFNELCGMMEGVLKPEDVTVRAPVPLEMRVAIVLYKLASSAEHRVVANQFAVHKSTVKKLCKCSAKEWSRRTSTTSSRCPLQKKPSALQADLNRISTSHKSLGAMGPMGQIDGTHIPVLLPSNGSKDFSNRKGWPSYVLQAMVDDMYR